IDFVNGLNFEQNLDNMMAFLNQSKNANYKIEQHDGPNSQQASIYILDKNGRPTSLPRIVMSTIANPDGGFHTSVSFEGSMTNEKVQIMAMQMLKSIALENY